MAEQRIFNWSLHVKASQHTLCFLSCCPDFAYSCSLVILINDSVYSNLPYILLCTVFEFCNMWHYDLYVLFSSSLFCRYLDCHYCWQILQISNVSWMSAKRCYWCSMWCKDYIMFDFVFACAITVTSQAVYWLELLFHSALSSFFLPILLNAKNYNFRLKTFLYSLLI